MFLGAAAELLAAHLPGFSKTPAVAVLMAATAVSVLRLPLSATVIALLLTSKAGIATAPLIIVAVVVAYITIQTLSAARRPPAPPRPPRRPHNPSPPHPHPPQTGAAVSCRPFTRDRIRPSPRLPPSPNSKHRIGAYEKDGALVTGQQHYAAAKPDTPRVITQSG